MLNALYYTEHYTNTSSKETLPTVVLIHELFGNGDNLSGICRRLEADYRVINIDLPDHGRSPWSRTVTIFC